MGQNKEQLKKLLTFIDDIAKQDGNKWFVDELLKKISSISSIEELSNNSVIQEIHEYCVQKIILKQADDFYGDFVIESLKIQLKEDFIKMEHERRRDDFYNFSLCVYQQIENITNYLFDELVIKDWNSEKDKLAIKSNYNYQLKLYTFPDKGGKSIDRLIFEGSPDKKWYANRKFRAVLFFFYFNKDITSSDYEFNNIYYNQQEIYIVRNQNHRGNSQSDYQKQVLAKIKGNESKYYLKFYGFLEDFIMKINNSSILNKRKSENKNLKNTIGNSNHVLQELLNKMKD